MTTKIIAITLMAALLIAIISAVNLTTVQAKTVISDGYTLDVPNGWKVKDKENRFSGFDKTIEYNKGGKVGTVKIEHGDTFASVSVNALETVMEKLHPEASIFESGDNKYFVNNQSAPYVIATMDKTNLFGYTNHFVLMSISIPLNEDDGILIQYIATEDDFDKLLNQVEGMIQSVKPTGSVSSVNLDPADQEKLTGYGAN